MKKELLLSLLLVGVLASNANASDKIDSGWYIGANLGIMNFGGDLEMDNGRHTYKSTEDVDDSPFMLKVGYLKDNEDRFEFYYKKDSIDVIREVFETSTFGLKYEWGLSSLSKDALLPYITLGFGLGKSSSDFEAQDDGTVLELDLGIGVHYTINKNVDFSVGLYRRAIATVTEIETYDYYYGYEEDEDYTTTAAVNGIEIGVSYHF